MPYDPSNTIIYANCQLYSSGGGNSGFIIEDGVPKPVAKYLAEFPTGYFSKAGQKDRCCNCASNVRSIEETAQGKDAYSNENPKMNWLGNGNENWGIHSVIVPEDGSVGVTIVHTDGKECSLDRSMNTKGNPACQFGSKDAANVTAVRAQKICTHPRWRWDPDCTDNTNPKIIFPKSNDPKVIMKNQTRDCNKKEAFLDASMNPVCIAFCKKNKEQCVKGVVDYCTGDERKGKDEGLCALPDVQKLIQQSGLCLNSPSSLSTPACQEFCYGSEGSGIPTCISQIKAYCVGDNIKSVFCRKVLTNEEMWGNHNEEMAKYCATPAGVSSGLCNCYDQARIDELGRTIADSVMSRKVRDNPSCFLKGCADVKAVYKTVSTVGACPSIEVCPNQKQAAPLLYIPNEDDELEFLDARCKRISPEIQAEIDRIRNKFTKSFFDSFGKDTPPPPPPPSSSKNTLLLVGGSCSLLCCCAIVVLLLVFVMMKK